MCFKACGLEKESGFPASAGAALDLTLVKYKKVKKALDRNNLAIACLTIVFTIEGLVKKVCKSCALEFPSRLIHSIVEDLLEEYRPKDQLSKVEV